MNKLLAMALTGSLTVHAVFFAVVFPDGSRIMPQTAGGNIVEISLATKGAVHKAPLAVKNTKAPADRSKPKSAALVKTIAVTAGNMTAPEPPRKTPAEDSIEDEQNSGNLTPQVSLAGSEQGSGESTKTINTNSVIIPPEELYFPEPKYPVLAKKRNLEGSVRLFISVDSIGNVVEIKVIKSSGHKILDDAALSVKDRLRYNPATVNGKPAAFVLTKTITFVLKKGL